ncbi:MAG: response regulator [Verrucomicrobiota bacterium]|jgi:DNA-binding response OmpR family regulator
MKVNRTILFVEDDAVVLTTYRNLLQREGFRIESAQDGLEALKALSQATPDLVVLDLMLPKFDGADVLKFIRADPRLKSVPIIIFSNVQITDFAEDAITRQLRKTDCTPSILVQTIQEMLIGSPASAPNAANAVRTDYAPAIKLHMANDSSAGEHNDDATEAPADETSPTKGRVDFLKDAPADIAKVREHCLAYIKAPTSTAKLEPLSQSVHSLNANASKAGCGRIALLTKAFDMLLSKIASKPARVTPSILQTLAEAADCLGLLLKSDEAGSTEAAPRAKVLAVDDDTVCNHVIVNTLKRANLDIVSVEDPLEGLKLLQTNHYDLVLLDIDMPKLTGFEVCEKLRALPHYKTTPVIFVTAHSNFGNRTQGVLSGGNYFITKPVDPLELALKVTIHLFKAQVQHAGAPQPEAKPEAKPEVKPQAAKAPEIAPKPPVPTPASQQTNGNGNMNGKAKNGDSSSVPLPKAQPRPATAPEVVSKPAPPVLKSVAPVPINPSKNGRGNNTPAMPALSMAPPVPPSTARSVKPRAANISKVMPPLSVAPTLDETGTLNVSKLSGSRNRNRIMNNEQDETFEKVVVAVVRIIFGDDNLTEMNVRLVRIALERYNVHEIINSPVVA